MDSNVPRVRGMVRSMWAGEPFYAVGGITGGGTAVAGIKPTMSGQEEVWENSVGYAIAINIDRFIPGFAMDAVATSQQFFDICKQITGNGHWPSSNTDLFPVVGF